MWSNQSIATSDEEIKYDTWDIFLSSLNKRIYDHDHELKHIDSLKYQRETMQFSKSGDRYMYSSVYVFSWHAVFTHDVLIDTNGTPHA